MRIAVLSQSAELHSTRRLLETGRKAGHVVSIIDYLQCRIALGGPAPVYFQGDSFPEVHGIIPRIGASNTRHGVALVQQLEAMGMVTVASADAIATSRDKLRSLQALERAHVPIPKTAFGTNLYDPRALVRAVGGPPVVVKVLEGTQGVGVVLCESMNAAESAIEAFRSLNTAVLVQELIAEAHGTDLRCIVVGHRVVASMVRRARPDEFRSNLHRGGTCEGVEPSNRERKIAIAAAKATGLRVAGVDILRSDRGPLVVEVNSSPGLEGIERATRLDVAGAIIRHIAKLHRAAA